MFVYCSCGADRKSFNMKIFLLSLYISNISDKSNLVDQLHIKNEYIKGNNNIKI